MAPKKKEKENLEKKVDGRRRPQRKIEILQAAIRLLEQGSRKVTTADLAAEVGVSEAALYRHYKSKAAIFRALTEHIEEHLLKPTDQLLDDDEATLPHLHRLMDYHIRFFDDHPGLCRVFLVEGVVTRLEGDRMGDIIREYSHRIGHLVERGQKRGELDDGLPKESVVSLFVGIIQSSAMRYILASFKVPQAGEIGGLWHLFKRAVLPSRGPVKPI